MIRRLLTAVLVAVSIAAATLLSAVRGGGIQPVLSLHRAFPIDENVELHVIKARDRARHARILQSFSGGIVDFQVVGSSDPYVVGLYFTKVRLGSPPREFNVQIDTGSDILWVACSSCTDCPRNSGFGIPLNFFDPTASSTVSSISCSDNICASIVQTESAECFGESNQCGYSFQYADQSGTAGYYISDLLYFDSILGTSLVANSSAPIIFGCSTSLFGDLTKSTKALDGIFGFGRQDLSVISQLSLHKITPKVFSHCLKGDGNGGGIFVLGEILDPRIVYTPLAPSQSHYNLYLQSIAVNEQLLPIDPSVFTTSVNQGTIVDSGTTLAYLVEGAYEPFIASITAVVSTWATPITSNGNQCYLVPKSVAEQFPPVTFNFAGGAFMFLRPSDYLVHSGFVDGAAMWCVGFLKAPSPGISILGDLVLKDKIVVYDLSHQRIGWADYDYEFDEQEPVNSRTNSFQQGGNDENGQSIDDDDVELQFRSPVTRLRAKKFQQYLQVLVRRKFELEDQEVKRSLRVVNVLSLEDQDNRASDGVREEIMSSRDVADRDPNLHGPRPHLERSTDSCLTSRTASFGEEGLH